MKEMMLQLLQCLVLPAGQQGCSCHKKRGSNSSSSSNCLTRLELKAEWAQVQQLQEQQQLRL
jgi:cell division protein FtsL